MSIELTPAAREHVLRFLSPQAPGLRFGIKRTGCSGWGYVIEAAREQTDTDVVFESEGLRVLVDAQSLPLIDGTRIDYRQRGINFEFVFDNPNATALCGCGESFTTRRDPD